MKRPIILSVDAYGGDNAPRAVLEGINLFLKKTKNVTFHIFGKEEALRRMLKKFPKITKFIKIFNAKSVIRGDQKVAEAIRDRDSSLWMAIDHVKQGNADAVISAGNTGVLMAMSKLSFRTMDGISRPAIVSMWPSKQGKVVMLDLGANSETDARNLIDFSLMGAIYSKVMTGTQKPTLGILNIGEEQTKGNDVLRETYTYWKEHPTNLFEFHGFVEGNDILAGTTDVVVTDGFTGNVALKTVEGSAKFIGGLLKNMFKRTWVNKIAYLLLKSSIRLLKKTIDPREYSGAVFVGLNHLSVKTHGGSDKVAFMNAFNYAVNLVENDFNEKVKEQVEQISR
ncbi:MAG: phosphate acyltransferase PlsX [Rickettsiales bacterium]|jgi:glycerol-3-phosphate acyltransferase PlsX|nr:phosphate acyltransferase PlsX [Rickettsiales bacterium]